MGCKQYLTVFLISVSYTNVQSNIKTELICNPVIYFLSLGWGVLLLLFFFFLILKSLIRTCVPKHETPSHLPPHNISLGHPHAPALSKLHPTSDMDWRFNSYITVYMLEFPFSQIIPPSPSPSESKVRYTHLCLFSYLAYRVVIAIFLNSIYMC